jgi:hypothetical protein
MALVRCEKCKVQRNAEDYVQAVEPVGFPTTAVICGSVGCANPGLIWLKAEEKSAFENGQRVFELATHATKVQAR